MFNNVFNFRDVSLADKSRLRSGRLYRSDSLSRLDDVDWTVFRALSIRTVLDLRTPSEVEKHGRIRTSDALAYHNLSVLHTDWRQFPYSPETGVPRYLADRYLGITEEGTEELRGALTLLAAPESSPAVIHCAGGRDRTGVLTALILGLLDVPADLIAADYARTAETAHLVTAWLVTEYGGHFGDAPQYTQTPAEAMLTFLADLTARHGGVRGYVASIGVDPETVRSLRAHLLAA